MAARAVCLTHWIWIVVLLVGIPIQWVLPRYGLIQIIALAGTLASLLWWKQCPLTLVENALRARSEAGGVYNGSFLRHRMKKVGVHIPPGAIVATLTTMLMISVALWTITFFL